MSTVPVVSFWSGDNTTEVSSWAIGVINAGSSSPVLNMLIWNNRAGIADVSDMQDCKLTVLDSTLGETIPLVTEKWVGVRVDSAGETGETDESFTRIGGNDPVGGTPRNTKDIKALGQTDFTIKGTANTGVLTDTANFAEVTAKVFVPLNAPAGAQSFKVRVSYFYT